MNFVGKAWFVPKDSPRPLFFFRKVLLVAVDCLEPDGRV